VPFHGSPARLVSVSDKTGLVPFAKRLAASRRAPLHRRHAQGARRGRLKVVQVGDYTQAPEILGGRVKTLHPRVHGGILHRRGLASDEADVKARHPADRSRLVNLYPFRQAVAAGKPFAECVEEIDIGGPARWWRARRPRTRRTWGSSWTRGLRAGRGELERRRRSSDATRFHLMRRRSRTPPRTTPPSRVLGSRETPDAGPRTSLPRSAPSTRRSRTCATARTRTRPAPSTRGPGAGRAHRRVREGPPGEGAQLQQPPRPRGRRRAGEEHAGPACVIIKHNTPCGVALGASVAEAFSRARRAIRSSAFGGIVALNRPVDHATSLELSSSSSSVVIAPSYAADARAGLAVKKNLRLLERRASAGPLVLEAPPDELRELRSSGGLLVMDRDSGRSAARTAR